VRRSAATVNTAFKVALAPALLCMVGLISPSGVPVPLAQFIFLASMALSIWIYLPRARRA
jgi:hypothetical protein